jgi:hypothetical protein
MFLSFNASRRHTCLPGSVIGAIALAAALTILLSSSARAVPAPIKPMIGLDTKPLEDDYVTAPTGDTTVDDPLETKRTETDVRSDVDTFATRLRVFTFRLFFHLLDR